MRGTLQFQGLKTARPTSLYALDVAPLSAFPGAESSGRLPKKKSNGVKSEIVSGVILRLYFQVPTLETDWPYGLRAAADYQAPKAKQ